MARRPAHLDPSHPPWPHSTRRPLVARKSLPNLEPPQHVRPHQAGLPLRHEPRRLTSWTRPPTAARSLMRESNPDYNGVWFGEIETSNRKWRRFRGPQGPFFGQAGLILRDLAEAHSRMQCVFSTKVQQQANSTRSAIMLSY